MIYVRLTTCYLGLLEHIGSISKDTRGGKFKVNNSLGNLHIEKGYKIFKKIEFTKVRR